MILDVVAAAPIAEVSGVAAFVAVATVLVWVIRSLSAEVRSWRLDRSNARLRERLAFSQSEAVLVALANGLNPHHFCKPPSLPTGHKTDPGVTQ